MSDTIEETNLAGVLLISRPVLPDDRGFFKEIYRKNELEERLGIEFNPVQANQARSSKYTLRGIHASPWNKLVSVMKGSAQIVIVDLHEDSATFGEHFTQVLGEGDHKSIFIPKGYGNSYLVLSEEVDCLYITDAYWGPGLEKSVIWNDPDLKIEWMLKGNKPVLSEKDQKNPTLREVFPGKF